MGNRNSTSSKSKVHYGPRSKVVSSESAQHVPRTKAEPVVVVGFPTDEGSLRLKEHSEQHGKKSLSLDSDDTFTEFIRRAKYKIRSISNIGREQSNFAPASTLEGANINVINNSNDENEKDQFADFIKVAKKKLKTTSRVGNNSSFRG
ncbi:hypothetical protein Lal_00019371 [Lupinus albus]|uniref:Uncharacterized protein n=1 Tax=Lupinus albus TaxID=3870 RepID=A0A6A5PN06_LUPAL|nr:hypothetical protein Lalb_Chr01g0006101 [Lupinus albus]KAF1899246.1 hypothetical protein Lal_00019371 [Lupinus albus]